MTTPITWNATDIAAGVRDIRGKWVNSPYYRSGSVEWNPLTPTFLNDGNKWQTDECPVIVSAPRVATQPIQFVNGVSWDVHAGTAIAAAQNELLVSHPGASPVEGIVLEGRESQVLYRNAITDGIDIAVGVWHGRGPRAEHIYVIRRMPSGDSEFVEIESQVTAIGSRVAGWDGASLLEIGNTSIVDRADDRRGWTLRPAVAWYYDAAGNMVSTPIVARMQLLSRGNVKVTKFVPRALIATALAARENGELRCDLTGTFYPDANTETTTHDAWLRYYNASTTWSTIRDAASAATMSDSQTVAYAEVSTSTTTNQWDIFRRSQFGFDLTSLAGVTVSAADFILFSSTTPTTTLGSQSYNVVETTPSSWTASSLSDYGASQTTKLISDGTVASWPTANGQVTSALNMSGITAVQNKVGDRIMFMVRIASDIENSTPSWSSDVTARIDMQTADAAGTTYDPRLFITYNTGGGSIAAIANHYARMRSN